MVNYNYVEVRGPKNKNKASLQVRYHLLILSDWFSLQSSKTTMAVPIMAFSSAPYSLSPLRSTFLYPPLSLSHSFTSPPIFSSSQSSPKSSFDTKIRCVSKEQAPPTPGFDPKAGIAVYKPKSYEVLVTDAAKSLAFALEDGKIRLEIDFP